MTLPANIRVNTAVPFPALVQPSGPITIAKNNGIWTIGFTITAFGSQVPLVGNYPTDFLLAWDDVNKTFFKVSITNLIASIIATFPTRTQRLVTTSPVGVGASDMIINTNIASGSPTCQLPAAAGRLGVPVTFKDIGGQWAAHPLTFTCTGGDLIDGQASVSGAGAYGAITFVPANDGTSSGWSIE